MRFLNFELHLFGVVSHEFADIENLTSSDGWTLTWCDLYLYTSNKSSHSFLRPQTENNGVVMRMKITVASVVATTAALWLGTLMES
mgnify:CR=1 FL=1